MKVIVTEQLHENLLILLGNAGFLCSYKPEITFEELENEIQNFEGLIIRSKFSIQKEFLIKAKNLRFIGRLGAGMENIDTDFAQIQGVECINSPEGNRDAVGEHAIGMILALKHKILKANSEVKNGIWQRNNNRGLEIHGKTVGIIGYGNMGSAFAQRLSCFEANVIAYDKYKMNFSEKYVKEVDLQTIFDQSDILSIHTPQTSETIFMVDDTFINNFKRPIYLINTARGKIVKTTDLVKNLKSGKILGACLDVLEYEKTSFENLFNQNLSEDFKYLIESENVILTPHIAGRTYESEEKLAVHLAKKIIKQIKIK